jgi:hypothetical protein
MGDHLLSGVDLLAGEALPVIAGPGALVSEDALHSGPAGPVLLGPRPGGRVGAPNATAIKLLKVSAPGWTGRGVDDHDSATMLAPVRTMAECQPWCR